VQDNQGGLGFIPQFEHRIIKINMYIKYFTAVVISAALMVSTYANAEKAFEKMPESPRVKASNLEREVNDIFQRAMMAAAVDLNDDHVVRPFAVIKRKDGKIGVFSADETEKNKNLSVNEQTAGIRRMLIELVVANQLDATAQVMFATVKDKNGNVRQGLSFEIEHIDGLSIVRFLPVVELKDEAGVKTGKLLFETESMSTALKPKVIFSFASAL